MESLTRLIAAAAVVAAAAVAGVLLLARSSAEPSLRPSQAVEIRAAFEPPAPAFGDAVDARVSVLLDRSVVRPETLRLAEGFAPLTELAPARTTRYRRGGVTVVSVVQRVACLTDPCVARSGETPVTPRPVEATVSSRGGRTLRLRATWPALRVRSRVVAADLASAEPAFRASTLPPSPTYRVRPSRLAFVLDVLAVLLAVAGVALGALEVRRLALRRRGAVRVGELERALQLAREAESRPAPDRRRALGLLARLLGGREAGLASAASDLAWSEPAPESRAVSELVSEVEREVPAR